MKTRLCYRQAFYPDFCIITMQPSVNFHPRLTLGTQLTKLCHQAYILMCCGLLAGLYLFTCYALRLTVLRTAFGLGSPAHHSLGLYGLPRLIPQSKSSISTREDYCIYL